MNGENIQALEDCQREILKIEDWINHHQLDSNIKFLVSYAVIKASGTIEAVLKSSLYEYLSKNAMEETKSFLQKNILEASFNPSTKQVSNIFDKLNSSWSQIFLEQTKSLQEKTDLNSLVSLRNDFAHGSSITTSIQTVKRYFVSGKRILEIIDDIILDKEASVAGGV